ncbi:MAG: hypothetical protein H8E85_00070, partial [Candidatus Marinimicrobia bacterium]|nr:hypothetical protein [Candidatus Neomarinimicrobiota bacterium]
MITYLFFLLFIGVVSSQHLSITPELTYQYESDNEQYIAEGLAVQDYELIIIGKYRKDKLNILARMGYHLI